MAREAAKRSKTALSAATSVAIAVTGMHRTGTSVVARMLREAGLWFGDDDSFISPASDNPEGFFEHERLVRLNDELLEATGGAWDHPPASGPMAGDDPRVAHLTERAHTTIGQLSSQDRWGWKDPRVCLTAAFWLDIVPDLRFIVCVRNPIEVAMSLKRRNRISYALGLSLWERYYRELLDIVPPARRLVTHFEGIFEAGAREVNRILDFASVPLPDRTRVLQAVHPELRHQRAQVSLSDAGVSSTTIDLYALLCEEAGWAAQTDVPTSAQVDVHAAVLDLAASKEQAQRQDQAIGALQSRLGDVSNERDDLEDRVRELEGERAALVGTLRQVEEERDRLSNQVGSLQKTTLLLGERLAAVENDATASMVTSLDERVENLTQGVFHLIERSNGARDPVADAGRRAIYDHVPIHGSVLVAGKSDPAYGEIFGRKVTNFPQDVSGRYPGFALSTSQALLAHLEALRCAGNEFLLIPPSSQWLLEHYAAFGEYLLEHYRVTAADPNIGMLFNIIVRQSSTAAWPGGLSGVIDRIASGSRRDVAVLDMTHLDVAAWTPGHNVFSPPSPGGMLPYLDSTVDVVVIENDDDLPEARRTAVEAIVHIRRGRNGALEVSGVETMSSGAAKTQGRIAVVLGSKSTSTQWADQLTEALEEEPSAFLVTSTDSLDRAEMVAVVEEGVLPLPSCLAEAGRLLSDSGKTGGIAVKMVGAHGELEAAGTMLFADGSVAGIGEGSFDIGAAWHEYVREACWGPGLMVFRAEAVGDLVLGSAPYDLARCAEHVWRTGYRVLYQPAAAAVRIAPAINAGARGADAWSGHLVGRPGRPPVLDEASWRTLLAGEEVAGGMR